MSSGEIIIKDKGSDLTTTTISYCGYQLKDFSLPSDYSDFKIQLKKTFSLEQILKEDDPIKIHYKDDKENKEVNDDSDYNAMVEYISGKKGNAIVYVETEKIPVSFEGGNSIEFEDEIKKVVERELRIAANNIKKCLTTNISLSNSKKVRTQCCKECKKQDKGTISITPSTYMALKYIIEAPSKKLFNFNLKDESLKELKLLSNIYFNQKLEKEYKF